MKCRIRPLSPSPSPSPSHSRPLSLSNNRFTRFSYSYLRYFFLFLLQFLSIYSELSCAFVSTSSSSFFIRFHICSNKQKNKPKSVSSLEHIWAEQFSSMSRFIFLLSLSLARAFVCYSQYHYSLLSLEQIKRQKCNCLSSEPTAPVERITRR